MTQMIQQISCDQVKLPPIPEHLVNGIYGNGESHLVRCRLIHWLSQSAGFMSNSQPVQELQQAALKHHVKLIDELQQIQNPTFSIFHVEVDPDE